MTQTNYDEILPNGIIFNLQLLEKQNILKVSMAKKLIANGKLEIVKIGNKIHIARTELIRYLDENTIPKTA